MIQLNAGTRIFICVETTDFRMGIDGLKDICKVKLKKDPFSGIVFLFRNKRKNNIKILSFDGQGFWLMQKRLSQGTFKWWPNTIEDTYSLTMYELQVFLGNGNPELANMEKNWKKVP